MRPPSLQPPDDPQPSAFGGTDFDASHWAPVRSPDLFSYPVPLSYAERPNEASLWTSNELGLLHPSHPQPPWSEPNHGFREALRQQQMAMPPMWRSSSDGAVSTISSSDVHVAANAWLAGPSAPFVAPPVTLSPERFVGRGPHSGFRPTSTPASPADSTTSSPAPQQHPFALQMPVRSRRRSSSAQSHGSESVSASPRPSFSGIPDPATYLAATSLAGFSIEPMTQQPQLHFQYGKNADPAAMATAQTTFAPIASTSRPSGTAGRSSSFDAQVSPALRAKLADRPHKCDQCIQSFNRMHDLKRHKRIHLTVKPFPCGWCPKQFSRKDALKRHLLIKGCGQGFGQTKELSEQGISMAPALRGGVNPTSEDDSCAIADSPVAMPPPDIFEPGPYQPDPPFLGRHSVSDESKGSSSSSGTANSAVSLSTVATSIHPQSFDYGVSYPKLPPPPSRSLHEDDHDRTLMPSLRHVPPAPSLQQSDSLLPPVSPGELKLSPYPVSSADAYFEPHF